MATSSRQKPPVWANRPETVKYLTRVAVQASKRDAGLIRSLAQRLRANDERAKALRPTLERALTDPAIETAFAIFCSDLPDEAFSGVFDQPRPKGWREVDLGNFFWTPTVAFCQAGLRMQWKTDIPTELQ